MHVRDVMTPAVETIGCNDTIQTAAERMRDNNFGSMPVCDGDKLVGVITDRDIAIRAVAEGGTVEQSVSAIMTPEIVHVSSDASTADAARLMAEKQVRRLYVIDNDKLTGVVALADLANEAPEAASTKALEGVSRD